MTFTKERLTALSNRENVGAILAEEIAELARIALASLEAEAVAYVMADDLKDSSIISTPAYRDLGEARERTVGDVVALYSAPPAPVSVTDELARRIPEILRTGKANRWEIQALAKVCSAAMLQGADGNSPVVPDGWVACSERMPEGMVTVITSNGSDTGHGWWDGDCWQTWAYHDAVPGEVTYWMPLPAAPQEDVSTATDNTAQQFEALATSAVHHRVSGWSERQQKVISYSLWRFMRSAYELASQEGRLGNKDDFDRFMNDAKDAEEIRAEFTSAWSSKP